MFYTSYPIECDPRDVGVLWSESLSLQGILMHKTVSKTSSYTWFYSPPFHRRGIQLQTLGQKVQTFRLVPHFWATMHNELNTMWLFLTHRLGCIYHIWWRLHTVNNWKCCMSSDIQNASLLKQDDKHLIMIKMTCNCSRMKTFYLLSDYLNQVSLAFQLAMLARKQILFRKFLK